jgi:hypothetical protein
VKAIPHMGFRFGKFILKNCFLNHGIKNAQLPRGIKVVFGFKGLVLLVSYESSPLRTSPNTPLPHSHTYSRPLLRRCPMHRNRINTLEIWICASNIYYFRDNMKLEFQIYIQFWDKTNPITIINQSSILYLFSYKMI